MQDASFQVLITMSAGLLYGGLLYDLYGPADIVIKASWTRHGASIDSADADGSRSIDREELGAALSRRLGRPLTDRELALLFETLDTDNDGTVSSTEWVAGGGAGPETIAGMARALFQTLLRVMPRTPAMRFFKPKDQRLRSVMEGERKTLGERVTGKLALMSVSAGASFVLFKSHGATKRQEAIGSEIRRDFVGGAVGGMLHACVVQPFARPAAQGVPWWHLRPRLSGLSVLALKDALGFGCFFGVHTYAQHPYPQDPNHRHLGSESHLRTAGLSVAAGAIAGSAFHFVSYPLDQALALAHPETHPMRVAETMRHHGVAALYHGVLRSAAPGVCMGALTFGLYDAALRYADEESRR